MKKLILVLILGITVLGVVGLSEAGLLENVPDLKQGVGYDLSKDDGGNILSLTTAEIITWKDKSGKERAGIGAGVMTELDNNDNIDPVATVSYKIGGLEDLGFNYPLAKIVNIEIGGFVGRDLNEEHFRYGVQATIIKVKL